jgi:transposase
MTRPGRYPQELRERAVRLVFEHQDEHPSQWAAITSIAHKFGVSAETLRNWVRRAETDDGLRPGLTSDERQRLKTLERENRELRRANEILKSASAFFAAELCATRRRDDRGRVRDRPRRAVAAAW